MRQQCCWWVRGGRTGQGSRPDWIWTFPWLLLNVHRWSQLLLLWKKPVKFCSSYKLQSKMNPKRVTCFISVGKETDRLQMCLFFFLFPNYWIILTLHWSQRENMRVRNEMFFVFLPVCASSRRSTSWFSFTSSYVTRTFLPRSGAEAGITLSVWIAPDTLLRRGELDPSSDARFAHLYKVVGVSGFLFLVSV